MTGCAFLAILCAALCFSAGFAGGTFWTAYSDHQRRLRNWREINRRLDAAEDRLNLNTTTETDNDHRPR